jgi:hypothetical protein
MPESGIPISELSGSGATRELHETVKAFNAVAGRQAQTLIRLTWVIVGLTAVMLVAVCVQVWMALRYS